MAQQHEATAARRNINKSKLQSKVMIGIKTLITKYILKYTRQVAVFQ